MKIGSLCSGVAGLDMAVERVFGAETAWFAEYDAAPSKVLAHRYPNVPNHGDMTTIDWAAIEPVDVITGGTPCQDLSAAGKRQGMTEGTRSNLWVLMREAVATIRPEWVIWENVRGAYSAAADSEMERTEGRLGDRGDGLVLRALGRVLGDLASLGYDTRYGLVRASDAGAPHGRARVFLVAQDADREPGRERGFAASGQAEGGWSRADVGGRGGASTANPAGVGRDGWAEDARRGTVRAPVARDHTTPSDAARIGWGEGRPESARWSRGPAPVVRSGADWGPYEPAIRRWEHVTGRNAPAPTRPDGRDGARRLNPELSEWMMGFPAGWITDPQLGLTRNDQLKIAGNAVCPPQAELALRTLLGMQEMAA